VWRLEQTTLVTTPSATVLLATRNRASTLESVLDEYCRLESPPGGWDLVIVDNGSTDRTADVVRSFGGKLPIRYAYEPTPGKNAALNTGLRLVTGDLVVFTDDDIYPSADWLVQLCAAAGAHESYTVFSGVILPRWEAKPSGMVLRVIPLGVSFAIHPPGLREGPTRPAMVFGGNVAIRAEVFRNGFTFDPTIGPRPAPYAMGSESELIRRLDSEGLGIWCCEKAVVQHLIPRSHLDVSWILERARHCGRAQFRFGDDRRNRPVWLGLPRWIYRAVAAEILNGARAVLAGDEARLLQARWEMHLLFGISSEARKSNRAKRTVVPAIAPEPSSPHVAGRAG
jgi:glycosyltransferase involved in cell wall biosynthesis